MIHSSDIPTKGLEVRRGHWRRFVSLTLMSGSLICFLPYASRTQSASAFSDLAGRESQAAAIEKMAAEGIIAPKSPGKFDPGGVFTRGEFAVAAQHLFKLPKPAKEIYFADVPKGSPLYDAVQAVAPFMDRGALCPECLLSSNFVADAPISHAYAVVSLARLNIAKNKVALVDPREVASALEGVPDVAGLSAEARQNRHRHQERRAAGLSRPSVRARREL
jgi:hypothetical protein